MSSVFTLPKIFSEFKNSIQLALPLIAAEIVFSMSGFLSTVMVAHLGKEQLAANALVWQIYLVIILLVIGVLCSVSIMTSQSFGAKDDRGVGICFKQGLIISVLFAVPMMLLLWFAPYLLVWTKQDPVVIALAKPYFRALIWTMFPLSIMFTIEQFLIGIAKTKMVLVISILTIPLQVFFFYAFLFGKFGFPQTGLDGLAYGILASHILVASVLFCYLFFAKDLKKYCLLNRWWEVNSKFLIEMIRVGLPLGFVLFVEVALFATVAIMMGVLGTTSLAAYQIAHQYFIVAIVLLFALTQGITARIGNEVGRNNKEAFGLVALVNTGIGFGMMSIFSVFYIWFPHIAIGLDIDIHAPHLQEIVSEATKFLFIAGILVFSECLRAISFGLLRGLKDTRFPVLVSIIGFWCIAFPCAYLLAFKFNFGGAGIWWGLVIGLFVSGVILFARFCRVIKHIDLKSLVTKSE